MDDSGLSHGRETSIFCTSKASSLFREYCFLLVSILSCPQAPWLSLVTQIPPTPWPQHTYTHPPHAHSRSCFPCLLRGAWFCLSRGKRFRELLFPPVSQGRVGGVVSLYSVHVTMCQVLIQVLHLFVPCYLHPSPWW